MKHLASLGFLILLVTWLTGCSCNDEDKTSNVQRPSSPTGSIEGTVTDLRNGQPLEGVTVSTIIPCTANCDKASPDVTIVTTKTDVAGHYSLQNLSGGASYRVTFELMGYVRRFGQAAIPSSTGEYPQGNAVTLLNMDMSSANASISGTIFARGGAVAAGATVVVDLRPSGWDYVQTVTADAKGVYTLNNLPGSPAGLAVTVVVLPYDDTVPPDGKPDYDSVSVGTETFPGTTTQLDIDLRPAAISLILLASDVDDGEHISDTQKDPIDALFNRGIDKDSIVITLTDQTAGQKVAIIWTYDPMTNTISIQTDGSTKLAEGNTFQLVISAKALNGDPGTFTRVFDVINRPSTSTLAPVTNLAVEPAVADWNTVTFTVSWDIVPDAKSYRIYARNVEPAAPGNPLRSMDNPTYLLVRTVGSQPGPNVSVTLPIAFDYFSADGVQTPFIYNTSVEFAVVPVNIYGDSDDPSTATSTVVVSDGTQPKIISNTQDVSANNTSGAPVTLKLTLTFSEYMSDTCMPLLRLIDPRMTYTWELDPGLKTGVFTIVVPPGVDGTGQFTVSGLCDTSNNPIEPYSGNLVSPYDLLTNGGFEQGGCSLTGWTPTTAPITVVTAPVAISSAVGPVHTGSCAARLGAPSGGTPVTNDEWGTSTLYRSVTLPAVAPTGSIVASLWFRLYSDDASALSPDYYFCRIAGTFSTIYLIPQFSVIAAPGTVAYAQATQSITSLQGQTVQIYCQVTENGTHQSALYLDDVSVIVTPF